MYSVYIHIKATRLHHGYQGYIYTTHLCFQRMRPNNNTARQLQNSSLLTVTFMRQFRGVHASLMCTYIVNKACIKRRYMNEALLILNLGHNNYRDCDGVKGVSACSNLFVNHASCTPSLSSPYMPLFINMQDFYLLVSTHASL